MHVWEVACSFFLSAVLQLKILYKFLPVNICMMQPIGSINERFQGLCLKDSGVLYEDPFIQVFLLIHASRFRVIDVPASLLHHGILT